VYVPPKFLSIPLASVCKHYRLGGHVDSDRKGLRRKQGLDETFRKKDLDNFLENRQQTTVMDANATL
jgi:TPP-dependent pyruvate/acetoin dehydrogenase alpha subunit